MTLEKIIILTTCYPPCNSTAASRPLSWAKYLHKFGYYPVVFCRNLLNEDQHYIERNEFFEVHYISYRDHYVRSTRTNIKNKIIRRPLGLIDYAFENSIGYNGIKNIGNFVSKYLVENEVKKMLASAPDYAIFGLAYTLCKKHKIKWVADYRDDWTSSELNSGFIFRLKNMADYFREKKYLRNCSFFTTVSQYYIEKVSNLIGKKGYLVENGFEPDENVETKIRHSNKLTILYPGLLYETQKIDIIGDALNLLPEDITEQIRFTFLGSVPLYSKLPGGIKNYVDKNIFFRDRIDKKEANQFLNNTDLLLFLTHHSRKPLKGVPSSKLYDFIRVKKAVLVCPTDDDVVEEKLKATGQGIFCNTAQELADNLEKLLFTKKEKGFIPLIDVPRDIYSTNTREFQAEKLARVLDQL